MCVCVCVFVCVCVCVCVVLSCRIVHGNAVLVACDFPLAAFVLPHCSILLLLF